MEITFVTGAMDGGGCAKMDHPHDGEGGRGYSAVACARVVWGRGCRLTCRVVWFECFGCWVGSWWAGGRL